MNLFNDLCPTTADVWLYVTCRIKNTRIKNTRGTNYFLPVLNLDLTLHNTNNGLNVNDFQIQKTRDFIGIVTHSCALQIKIFKNIEYNDKH